jgi:phosphonate transport system substrate-binding protein
MKRYTVYLILLIAVLLAACAPAAAPTAEATTAPATEAATAEVPAGRPLVLGDIADDPAKVIEGTQPFADYLAAKLAGAGITEGQVKIASSMDQMAQMIASGEVDLYFDSMYPATIVSDASGAQPILRRWKGGVGEYHSVIFVRKDSGITSVADLAGRKVAGEESFSTSGYALPATHLIEAGLNLHLMKAPEDSVAADQVGYAFSNDDDNTVQWVLSGKVDAGVTDNNYYAAIPKEALDQFMILAETESAPRQVVLASPKIDADLLAAIKAALLAAGSDPGAAAALDSFAHTARFDEFPTGIEAASTRMHEILKIIRELEAKP